LRRLISSWLTSFVVARDDTVPIEPTGGDIFGDRD
jgi:hypothetical protein